MGTDWDSLGFPSRKAVVRVARPHFNTFVGLFSIELVSSCSI